jgi:hypothetical protein
MLGQAANDMMMEEGAHYSLDCMCCWSRQMSAHLQLQPGGLLARQLSIVSTARRYLQKQQCHSVQVAVA